MGPTDRLYVELVANVGGFVTGMDRAAGSVQRVDASTGKVDKTLSRLGKGGLLALATGVAVVGRETLQLDTAMRNVNSISGMTETQLAATTDRLVQMSKVLPQSSSTLAEGLYDIASSGFQGAEGMKVLDAAATSASAGMTQTATSAKAITAVLNAYKKPAAEAADVSDILFQTVNLGVTSFEQLAHNVGDYIGQSQALGVEFAETGSAIATLTLNGTTAAQAGTTLGSVLNTLIKPSEDLTTVLERNGYASGTAAIEALGLRGTMQMLSEQSGGTAEGMSELFTDVQALRGALALTSNDGATYAEVAAKIEDRTSRAGAAQRALAEQSKAASFQLGLIRNQAVAAGVGLANMALPTVIDGLVAVQRGGQGAADVLGSIAGQLDGVFDSARTIGRDAVDVLLDVAAAAAPLAELGGKMVVGGLVVSLELLTGLLEPLVGFLADNEVVATALAIALGIHLLGGVTALATKIQVALVVALIDSIGAMGGAAAAARAMGAALTSTAAVAAAATAGIALALASVVIGYQRAGAAAKSLEDAQAAFDNADSLQEKVQGWKDMGEAARGVQDRMEQLRERSIGKTLIDLPGNIDALRMLISGTDDAADAMARAAAEGKVFETNVNALAERGFEPGSAAADRFHNDVVLTGQAFDDMLPLLEAAGVQTGDTFNVMAMKVDAYKDRTESAAGAQDQLVTALDGVQSKAKTTEEAVDALSAALDALIGIPLNAAEAAIAYEAALDSMSAKLAEVDENGQRLGTSLDRNTARGQENETSIIGVVKALQSKLEADAAAGASADDLSRTLATGRERLVEQANAAGLSREAMIKLLAQYGLTPDLVQTVVEAVGTDKATGAVKGVQKAIDDLHGKTVTVGVQYSSMGATRTVGTQGGLQEFANGGVREQHVAQIAPAGAMRLWAEPETGGEAYIPLAPAKRDRSEAILADVADRFGYRLEAFADGGFSRETRDRVYGDAIDWITKHAPKIPAAAPGMGVAAMMAALRAVFPGLALISGLRPGAITATGRPSYHGMGRATDIPPRMDVFNHLASAYPNSTELIFSPAGGRQRYKGQPHVYSGVTKAMHYDHIHWAMAKGGILNPYVRDAGGPLRPGFTYNGTDRDEMVVPMAAGGVIGPLGRATTLRAADGASAAVQRQMLVAQHDGARKAFEMAQAVTARTRAEAGLLTQTKAQHKAQEKLTVALAVEHAARVRYAVAISTLRAAEGKRPDVAAAATKKPVRTPLTGAVSATDRRSLAEATRGITDVDEIEAMVKQWEDYNAALKRNRGLIADLTSAQQELARARGTSDRDIAQAKREMDTDLKLAKTKAERAEAYKKYDAVVKDGAEARSAAYAKVADAQAAIKDQQREDAIDRERAAVDKLVASLEAQQRAREEEQRLREEQQRDRQEKLAELDRLLDEEAAIRQRGADAEQVYADKVVSIRTQVAQAQTDLQEQQQRLLDGRRDQLVGWAQLDQKAAMQWGNSVQQLLTNAQEQNARFEEWAVALAGARARGVSEQVIGALGLDEGPQALGQLQQFGQATVAEIAALNVEVARTTTLAGEQVARDQQAGYGTLGEGLRAAHAQYTDALAKLDDELVKAQADLLVAQASMATELAALGQTQGRSYGEALAAGLQSQVPMVVAAAAALQRAAGGATASATMVNGRYTDTMTGRAAFVGPNGEPGYAAAQAPPGSLAHTMPDGRTAYYLPVKKFDVGGYLEPGYTLAFNGTGQREHIPNPRGGGSAADGGVVAVEVTSLTVIDGQVIDRRVETKLGTLKRASQAHRRRR